MAAKKPSKSNKGATKPDASSNANSARWTFPKNTLEDALEVAKALEEKNAGKPLPAGELAIAVGYKQSRDWRFQDLLRSAN